jgi:hypothetical protein
MPTQNWNVELNAGGFWHLSGPNQEPFRSFHLDIFFKNISYQSYKNHNWKIFIIKILKHIEMSFL